MPYSGQYGQRTKAYRPAKAVIVVATQACVTSSASYDEYCVEEIAHNVDFVEYIEHIADGSFALQKRSEEMMEYFVLGRVGIQHVEKIMIALAACNRYDGKALRQRGQSATFVQLEQTLFLQTLHA